MALVQIEAYLNRKKKYFSTKVYLKPEQWDAKRRRVRNHPNADAINRMIYEYMAEIEKKELGLWQQNGYIGCFKRGIGKRARGGGVFSSFFP